ncbi:hypothetical protein AYI75_20100 [Shewanella algae]|uniref:NACHT domain-containing protein n=1 Tax=Shewanella algae TaxID=38313 RepID=UPI0011A14C3F|nr:hypothetical protein [Shewanella algae]TWO82630.1 hypothetical protein AYI75_20100 [Shewanella algae]
MLETITLESAIKLSTPLAKKLFNEKLKPVVTGRISQYFKSKADNKTFEKESVKYIARASGLCSIINTIAFPNTPKKLEELYIPLKIKDEKDNAIEINSEADIFENSNKILVSDTAGMGKSTLSKKVFLNIIQKQDNIPVFIELRQLTKESLAGQIASKFGIETKNPASFLKQLPLVYLFDGLDEVAVECKEFVIKEIRKFIDELDEPKILITSRLESYLSEFYDFTRFTIKPLAEKEAFTLISKYDPKGDVSKKLISGIERSRDRGLKEFLTTPLYVSLLYCAYRHKTVIPQKKHLFYSQVFDALFESHDLSKEISFVRPKHSNLDSSEFHLLLRRLGFWCLKNGGKIEFQKDQLEIIAQDIISKTSGINTSAVNFVKDLSTTVPLFVKEGSSLRWSHKSLMEYFASMFICNDAKEKQESLLLYLYQSNDWTSYKTIFELCADIDFTSLRSSVVKKVLEEYINYHNSNYQNITNKRIKAEDIEKRVGLTFGKIFGFRIIDGASFDFTNEALWSEDNPDILAIKDSCQAKNDEVAQVISFLGDKTIVYGINVLSRENMIVHILKYKLQNLFFDKLKKGNVNLPSELDKSSIKKNKLYIVSDSPTALINNSKNFHLINFLLSTGGIMPLDYNAVKCELDMITEDSSNGIDQLIGELG